MLPSALTAALRRITPALLAAWLCCAGPPNVLGVDALLVPAPLGQRVPETQSLRDLRGTKRGLSEFQGDRALVLVFLGVECPVANQYVPRLIELAAQFAPRGVVFLGVYPHEHESLMRVARHVLDREISFPVVRDLKQRLADALGVTRTPEACLLDARGMLVYRGRIDDQFRVGVAQPKIRREDLVEAIESLLAERSIAEPVTSPDGCLLDRTPAESAGPVPAFYPAIAEVLRRRCHDCHRTGGMAPFPLASHDDAVRWSQMIEEVVVEERMPPWHADAPEGFFSNDRRLLPAEQRQLLAWLRGGQPVGSPPLAAPAEDPATAAAREPTALDVLITSPREFQIPATGVMPYQYSLSAPEVTARLFAEDRWVEAFDVAPETPQVTHHVNAYLVAEDFSLDSFDSVDPRAIRGAFTWAAGRTALEFPPGSAMRVPRGTRVVWEVHYTPNGIAANDRPRLSLRFAKQEPRDEIGFLALLNEQFQIEPGDSHANSEAWFRLPL